jgi:pimeloyl-ACP methyl ester carboxylesterase
LSLLHASGDKRPFLLVHGLASNARMWEPAGALLAAQGHEVAAVDLRGHGRSEQAADGYDTATASDDLAALIAELGWTDNRRPVLSGQSWGGNVVLHVAAHHDAAHAIVTVDGGWIHLSNRFATFEDCWQVLAPPDFTSMTWPEVHSHITRLVAGWPPGSLEAILANLERGEDGLVRSRLQREHHRSILHSLWAGDPADWYPQIDIPTLLLAAGSEDDDPAKGHAVRQALDTIRTSRARWVPQAHHDMHLQFPEQVAAKMLAIVAAGEGADE